MKLIFEKQVNLVKLSEQLTTKFPILISKNFLGENVADFLIEGSQSSFSITFLNNVSESTVEQIRVAIANYQEPSSLPPLEQSNAIADAISIAFAPTPENSFLDAVNLQTALEQIVSHVANLQSQVIMLRAAQKQPNIYDTFNDLLNVSLKLHNLTNSQGSKWVEQVGNWSIQSNQAASNGTVGSLAWIESKIGLNCIVESDVTIADTTVPQGILFRYSSPTQYWRICYSKSNGKIILYEISGTAVNSRATANISLVNGQTYKFRVVLDDASISFYLNDELKISWSSVVNMDATKHGLYCSSSVATRFKNFKVIAI